MLNKYSFLKSLYSFLLTLFNVKNFFNYFFKNLLLLLLLLFFHFLNLFLIVAKIGFAKKDKMGVVIIIHGITGIEITKMIIGVIKINDIAIINRWLKERLVWSINVQLIFIKSALLILDFYSFVVLNLLLKYWKI
ncbi:hypothetical protein [Spiroplasma endosymbiont of Polydrusus pterygomalis]|uniref:hypothetical protein n=1 Tax=Spiroplasma endosymbiont of Polydrusus pterygomalis TaxID=3139327 RepID=UPI003CCB3F2B